MQTVNWEAYPPQEDGAEHTVRGTVRVLRGVQSPRLDNRRDVYVYLPPSYDREDGRRYPVLYMQDGQNLFDAATAYGEEWEVDETMEAISRRGMEAIVVGVPNMGEERLDEYSPFDDPKHGGGRGDDYVAFLTDTLKPIIDRELRTLPQRECTGVAGSSMGGLISLYAFFHRPDVFGFVGALSPSLWFGERAIFDFLESAPRVAGRIYLDVGTREGPRTVRDVRRARDLLHLKGYDASHDLLYVEEREASHEEAAWARRIWQALLFLLPPGTDREQVRSKR